MTGASAKPTGLSQAEPEVSALRASIPSAERIIQLAHERGDILAGDDGFFIYWPTHSESRGALTEWDLRTLADELERLNAPWAAEIDRYFASAIEARRAETQGGSVHESAPEGDAQ